MPTETELKLSISPEDHQRVSRSPLVRKHSDKRAGRKRLLSTYYDTADLKLLSNGIVLRVRRDGGRWLQAVKTTGASKGGLHQRAEYEAPVRSGAPDFEQLEKLEDCRIFTDATLREKIQPIFQTDFWRTTWQLGFSNGSLVELALDKGEVRHSGKAVPISEVELELKRGLPGMLYDLAGELSESVDLHIENTSKADRGYGILRASSPKPVRASTVSLEAGMTTEDALAEILLDCLNQVQANEPAVLRGEDPEGVHQMRVGLRRFRSALSLFRPVLPKRVLDIPSAAIPFLAGPLGPVRDGDVFLGEHVRPMLDVLADSHPFHVLRLATEQRRVDNYAELHARIHSREWNRALLALAAWAAQREWRNAMQPEERSRLQGPLPVQVERVLNRGHRRIIRHHASVKALREAGLHDLRIDIKRQRYAVEFFAALYRKKDRRLYRRSLTDLQELLGFLNDETVAKRLLGDLGLGPQRLEITAFVEGWFARARSENQSQLTNAWKAFRKRKRFWKKG